jgi:hypothetical protein
MAHPAFSVKFLQQGQQKSVCRLSNSTAEFKLKNVRIIILRQCPVTVKKNIEKSAV